MEVNRIGQNRNRSGKEAKGKTIDDADARLQQ